LLKTLTNRGLTGNKGKEIALLGETKGRILELLLQNYKNAAEIGDKLQIQKSAVRVHLDSMQAQGLVKSYFKIERYGRPRRIYELTESGRELFPRRYDVILSLILEKIEEMHGHEHLKKIIESIAVEVAIDTRDKIDKIQKGYKSDNIDASLNALNSISNEIGFVSSIIKEGDTYSILSRNCPVHKAALKNQDAICNGFHSRMIKKVLNGELNVNVQLKECIALGNDYSRHVITYNSGRKKKMK
jgi:predicted ArsR family transcriptional regulator